ncbi:MAG: hypothetical protein EOP00_03560 [Pedobacter sp.]|nr:MAG: hypothetical protein EOP00_03560 [Pedobacter sp.]
MKKLFGILLIIFGAILNFATIIGNLPNLIKAFSQTGTDANSLGYLAGTIIGLFLFTGLAIFMIIKGAKLVRNSKQKVIEQAEEY